MIKKLIKRSKVLLIDLLFPRFCVGCGKEGEFLCPKCTQDIIPVVSQVCPKCGKLSEGGRYHKKCQKDNVLKGIIAAAYFEEGPIREMIHNLKYNGVTELAEPLADLMTKSLILNSELNNYLITFAPLHWRRHAQRSYNQAELLARAIGNKLDMPVIDVLKKIKGTKRQVELKGDARRENLKNVFKVNKVCKVESFRRKTIILIDDVYTTGSTLNECARVLKHAGAKEVWGLVVARG